MSSVLYLVQHLYRNQVLYVCTYIISVYMYAHWQSAVRFEVFRVVSPLTQGLINLRHLLGKFKCIHILDQCDLV